MAVKIITMEIVSKKSGKAIEVSFPMGEGLFKASFSLPKKKRIQFLTEFDDGLIDDSLSPEEQCLRNEGEAMLYDAIEKLNEKQRKSHC